MTKVLDTQLENRQHHLAILICTVGKALDLLQAWEDENILPLIQAQDRQLFLQKHTQEYKVRLHKLLQKCFWAVPNWKQPATDWQLAELSNLIEAVSNNLADKQ